MGAQPGATIGCRRKGDERPATRRSMQTRKRSNKGTDFGKEQKTFSHEGSRSRISCRKRTGSRLSNKGRRETSYRGPGGVGTSHTENAERSRSQLCGT